MFLTKTKSGAYLPTYPSDHEESSKIPVGGEVKATQARNVDFHRKGFALLNLGFQNQDKQENFDIYRQIITMKAGFVLWGKDKEGKPYPFPESLAFNSMSAKRFQEWYDATLNVISKESELNKADIESELSGFY